jgi:hypothetical protein
LDLELTKSQHNYNLKMEESQEKSHKAFLYLYPIYSLDPGGKRINEDKPLTS